MIPMTLAEIAAVCRGTVQGDATLLVDAPPYLDSRSPVPGGLFVALVGERTDGHEYAAGATAVLGSRPTERPTVVVADPVVALARLARHVVDTVAPTVLAVTGSHGKTTTKNLLAALLPDAVATEGNLNNELGVPLTALRLEPGEEFLVLEMGSRGLGHLSWLCAIAPPRVGAVLGVGSAHLGEFGSLELTATAKAELVGSLPGNGIAVLNADDPRVARMTTPAAVLTFGRHGDVTWRGVRVDRLGRASFDLGHHGVWAPVSLRIAGAHQVANAAAAAAMALAVGVPLPVIADRLTQAEPPSTGRMSVHTRADGLVVIDDSYNANPESTTAALDALVSIGAHRSGRTIAVLGEMRELGPATRLAHERIGRLAREHGIDVVVAVGPVARPAGGVGLPIREDALGWLGREVRPDDTVLVKASRAAGLDVVAAALLAAATSHDRPPKVSR